MGIFNKMLNAIGVWMIISGDIVLGIVWAEEIFDLSWVNPSQPADFWMGVIMVVGTILFACMTYVILDSVVNDNN